jgi:hypothetical protein
MNFEKDGMCGQGLVYGTIKIRTLAKGAGRVILRRILTFN